MNKLAKYFLIILGGILIGVLTGSFIWLNNASLVKFLPAKLRHDFIVKARDYGIKMAQEEGKYRCCIEPPCTMCYMEANQWNNQTAGTCACDDFIAKGEEPCPQCAHAVSCDSHGEQKDSTTCPLPGN